MRRSIISWMAVPVLAVGVSACSADGAEDASVTVTTTQSSQTTSSSEVTVTTSPSSTSSSTTTTSSSTRPTTSTRTAASSTTSAPSSTPSGTGSSTAGSGGPATAPTTIAKVWIDDTWSVEQVAEDVCAPGGLTTTAYSYQVELFTCGPTAAGIKACTFADGGVTTCITDPLGHKAVRFTSPTVDNWDGEMYPRDAGPIPMYVDLEDGTRCSVVSHDHDQHWGGKFSWYSCSDGSELLTDESIAGTFANRTQAWTVQRSVSKGAPTTTWVKTAVFAGTR